jgi:hypothetical protein
MTPDRQAMVDALTAAMTMVPGLYSRNRMFSRFTDPVVRRARARSRMVRGLVRFASREEADVEITQTDGGRVRIRYRIARLRLERTVHLTALEHALLRVLVGGSRGSPSLQTLDDDYTLIEKALVILPKEEVSSVA